MQIIKQIENWQEIRDYCNDIKNANAFQEQAKCAKGRLNFWLQAEPDYSTGKYQKAVFDLYLWQICKELFPASDLAQVYFADNNKGIDWHKDAQYATQTARILNLGNAIIESKYADEITQLEVTGGELIEFNCKRLHRGTPLDDQRIGIGIWKARISLNDPKNWH